MRSILTMSVVLAAATSTHVGAQTERCAWGEGKPLDLSCSLAENEVEAKRFSDKHQQWYYVERPVQMAMLYSINTMFFGPPKSQVERRVGLTVTQGKGFKFVVISPGGFLFRANLACRASDCPIDVRFDQGPLKTYSTRNANGVSMHVVDVEDFLRNIRVSKSVTIVFPFVEYGENPFLFDVSNYKW